MKVLNLASNLIDTLDMKYNIKVLPKLDELNLSENRIERLEKHQFSNLIRLRKLDLSSNALEFIDAHVLQGLVFIENVDLRNRKNAGDELNLNIQGLNHLVQLSL